MFTTKSRRGQKERLAAIVEVRLSEGEQRPRGPLLIGYAHPHLDIIFRADSFFGNLIKP
jgi:hypothetical protein